MKTKYDFPRARPGVRDRLEFIVGDRLSGKPRRLDRYLQSRFPGYSRSFLQQLIKSGKLLLNDRTTKSSWHVSPGEKITLFLAPGADRTPAEVPFEVLFEDEHMLALNKPPGIVVHPARGHKTGTLFHGLLYRYRDKIAADPSFHIGTVHRLDVETSGVMVYALTKRANGGLTRQFENRLLRKTYLALVHGATDFDAKEVDAPLGIDPENRKRGAVCGLQARSAQSRVETLAHAEKSSPKTTSPNALNGFSLLRVKPRTGRAHQVRLHAMHLGHPLVGDPLYGGSDDSALFGGLPPRVCLHAESLHLHHPILKYPMLLSAPLPKDMIVAAHCIGIDTQSALNAHPLRPEPLPFFE